MSEAPRPQGGASRARSGEQVASKGNFVPIVPLDPAYKAGLAGHVPNFFRSLGGELLMIHTCQGEVLLKDLPFSFPKE